MPTNIQTIWALGITNRIFSFYLTEKHTCSMAYQYIYNRCMIAKEMYANVHIHITVFKIKVIVWLRSGFEKSSYIFYSVRLMFLVKSYSFILWWPPFFSLFLSSSLLGNFTGSFLPFLVPYKAISKIYL